MKSKLNFIIEKIKNNESTKGLYIFGDYGVGKTHIMKWFRQETKKVIKFGTENEIHIEFQADIIVWPDHIANLKKAMDKNKNFDYEFSINKLNNQKILIIDDIGGESCSDWELRDILFPILNYRIENKLTTFFTSNFSIKELENYYRKKCSSDSTMRIIDRIYGLTNEIKIIGKNWRREGNEW